MRVPPSDAPTPHSHLYWNLGEQGCNTPNTRYLLHRVARVLHRVGTKATTLGTRVSTKGTRGTTQGADYTGYPESSSAPPLHAIHHAMLCHVMSGPLLLLTLQHHLPYYWGP